ncbi:chalcone isomerase family protein [Uliginosibacterium gangwonense]|uniref:chalcone isomerase family protein n=1 Tax=Uliginosibacterium gangwonense TaxID=392736 RepID=UPI000364CF42|nr:chalcone isomerase family protein [Uliginosibacterium gangwonense]
MIQRLWCFSLWVLVAGVCLPVQAMELAGVNVDERVHVGNAELVLNGAGLRTRLMFKVYVAALYLPHRSSIAEDIIGKAGSRRVVLKMLRDVDGDTLLGALKEGLRDNHSTAQMQALQAGLGELTRVFQSVGTAKTGDSVVLDIGPEGLVVAINGTLRGQVADEAFGRAMLKIWLGEKPVDSSLKKALLGV